MTTWAQGTTRGNRKAKADALEHANYQCQLNLSGCTTDASIAERTATNPNQLQAVCPHCHQTPHTAAKTEASPKRPARRKRPTT